MISAVLLIILLSMSLKKMKKRSNNETDDLGKAIEKSIHELAAKNGYSY